MINGAIEIELNRIRLGGENPEIVEGMAFVFEDTPTSKTIGLFTLSFAKAFCENDPFYTWRAA